MSLIPAHVPPERVYDFDFVDDPILKPDPHQGLFELQRMAPEIFFTPRYEGHWVVQGHDAIYDMVHDTDVFSSAGSGEFTAIPISVDPPDHTHYRNALLQAFAPKTVMDLRPKIQQLSVELIENVLAHGRCDFVADIAEPLPVIIFMHMVGLPVEKMPELRRIIIEFLRSPGRVKMDALMKEMEEIIVPVMKARIEKREDDLISRLLDSRLGDRPPTVDEVRRYLLFLTTAGLDTTTNAMSFMLRHLASDRELQARVRADPNLIPSVIEEFLRRYAVSSIGRTLACDTEYRGVQFRKGDRVHLLVPSANLDPEVFPDPDQIRLDRDRPAVTFGTGIHRCLGSHLARLELRNVLTEWFARVPTFGLDSLAPPRMHAGFVYTVDTLPLIWDTGA